MDWQHLREALAEVLPDYVRRRPKDMMSYSSGLHERARDLAGAARWNAVLAVRERVCRSPH